jgi:hypothetical protein
MDAAVGAKRPDAVSLVSSSAWGYFLFFVK